MSKLIDKLQRMGKGSAPGLGFRVAAASKGPPLLLILRLAGLDAKLGAAAVKGGADAVLINAGEALERGKIRKSKLEALGDVPWGMGWEAESLKDMEPLVKGGCDFIVLEAAGAPAGVLLGRKGLGRVLVIEPSLADGLLRAVDLMPVDAVLLRKGLEAQPSLTVEHLMVCRRVTAFIHKPLLVEVSPQIDGDGLKALGEVGGKGVVVGLGAQEAAARLKELRQTIDELPAARREGTDVVLPRLETAVEPPGEEEDQ
ncbi:MAG: hypothetical protein ACE5IA_04080 [Dehalococcoidia bacterium]